MKAYVVLTQDLDPHNSYVMVKKVFVTLTEAFKCRNDYAKEHLSTDHWGEDEERIDEILKDMYVDDGDTALWIEASTIDFSGKQNLAAE